MYLGIYLRPEQSLVLVIDSKKTSEKIGKNEKKIQ